MQTIEFLFSSITSEYSESIPTTYPASVYFAIEHFKITERVVRLFSHREDSLSIFISGSGSDVFKYHILPYIPIVDIAVSLCKINKLWFREFYAFAYNIFMSQRIYYALKVMTESSFPKKHMNDEEMSRISSSSNESMFFKNNIGLMDYSEDSVGGKINILLANGIMSSDTRKVLKIRDNMIYDTNFIKIPFSYHPILCRGMRIRLDITPYLVTIDNRKFWKDTTTSFMIFLTKRHFKRNCSICAIPFAINVKSGNCYSVMITMCNVRSTFLGMYTNRGILDSKSLVFDATMNYVNGYVGNIYRDPNSINNIFTKGCIVKKRLVQVQ